MDSYNFLPDNEVTEVEGRKYLNPNLVVDETNTFIDRLRNTQQANMQQTATQTQRLGTDVPSNLGGLTGAGSYWSSRYVTPQTSSAVSNLRAAAQAQALNQALANEEARWKKKYQDAYNAYQKRSWDNSNGGGGGSGNPTGNPDKDGIVKTTVDDSEGGSYEPLGYNETKETGADIFAGKGQNVISYVINGKRYYANVYSQTGFANDRYTGMDTSEGMSYEGQKALDYLNDIVNRGGKIYASDGTTELTPYQALTGGLSSGR